MSIEKSAFATATRVVDTRLEQTQENNISFVLREGAQTVSYVPLTSSSHSNNCFLKLNNNDLSSVMCVVVLLMNRRKC